MTINTTELDLPELEGVAARVHFNKTAWPFLNGAWSILNSYEGLQLLDLGWEGIILRLYERMYSPVLLKNRIMGVEPKQKAMIVFARDPCAQDELIRVVKQTVSCIESEVEADN